MQLCCPHRTTVLGVPLILIPRDRHAEDPQSVEKLREAQTSRTRDGGGASCSHRGEASAKLAAIWVKVLHTLKNGYPAPTTATRAEPVNNSSTKATQWGSGPQS
jgi:hypothetical protein